MGPLCCRSWHKAKVFHWTVTGKEWIPAGKLFLSSFTDVLISLSLHMNVFLIDPIWVCWLKTVVWCPESGGQTPHWDPKGMEEEGMKQTDFIWKRKGTSTQFGVVAVVKSLMPAEQLKLIRRVCSLWLQVWLTLADQYLHSISIDWEKTLRFAFNERSNPDDDSLGIQIVKVSRWLILIQERRLCESESD